VGTQQACAQEKIERFDVDVTINQTGTVSIKETIYYDFSSLQKHGIYRKIPLIKENLDGKKYKLTVDNISVSDETGNPYNFTRSGEKEITLEIGDPDSTITGIHLYVIKYEVSGALTYFDDFDELYWNAVGTAWEVPIQNATVRITLPNRVFVEDTEVICYTGPLKSTVSDCAIGKMGNTLAFSLLSPFQYEIRSNSGLNAGEGITFALKFPKGYVAVLEPVKDKSGLIETIITVVVVIIFTLINIILPVKKASQLLKQRKNQKNKERIVAAWFDPPVAKDGSFYSPAETLAVLTGSLSSRALSAEIIYLAQKGYLKIISDGKKDFTFRKVKEADSNINTEQKSLFTALFGTKDETSTKELRKSTALGTKYATLRKNILKKLYDEGVYEKDLDKLRSKNSLISFFSMFVLGIGNSIIYAIAAKAEKPRTDLGIRAYSEAVSLKNFLSSQEESLDFQAEKQVFFERLLPYATAFGVEKVWAQRFEGLGLTNPDWYEGEFSPARMAIMSSILCNSVNGSISAAAPRSSSGFGSGFSGGSSGGGGGGGGGGSW